MEDWLREFSFVHQSPRSSACKQRTILSNKPVSETEMVANSASLCSPFPAPRDARPCPFALQTRTDLLADGIATFACSVENDPGQFPVLPS